MQRINAESGAKITVSIQWRGFSLGIKSFAADTYNHPICMLEIFIVFNPKNSEKLQRANVTAICACYRWEHPKQHLVSINWSLGLLKKKSPGLQQFCGNKFSLIDCRDCCKSDHQDSIQFYLKAGFCIIWMFLFQYLHCKCLFVYKLSSSAKITIYFCGHFSSVNLPLHLSNLSENVFFVFNCALQVYHNFHDEVSCGAIIINKKFLT